MTREGFLKILDRIAELRKIKDLYQIQDGKILISSNTGTVDFNFTIGFNDHSIKELPGNIEFVNSGPVRLDNTIGIDPTVVFNNNGYVSIKKLNTRTWNGNIKGINGRRLLNLMIKKELFI
jgi:hypothetical protein